MNSYSSPWLDRIAIIGMAVILFIPFLHQVHLFDWDEINFAEAAREMIVTGNYSMVQINYEPFWEKPPLFLWMQAISMNVFGVNEFAARFPNAICGVFTFLLLFEIGSNLRNRKFAWWWVALYASSLLPQLYFRSGIIDPWFNLFIFSGVYFAFRSLGSEKSNWKQHKWLALAGIAIGLATMTKGPVALLIFILTAGAYWFINEFKMIFSIKGLITFLLFFGATGSVWFISEIAAGRGEIVYQFIDYQIRLLQTQDAGHGGPFFYHWIVLLIGCFPLSAFALPALFNNRSSGSKGDFQRIMFLLFWIVLLLFSLVKTKIIHYSSFCYFPLSYFAAVGLTRMLATGQMKLNFKLLLGSLGLLWVLIESAVPLLGSQAEMLSTANWIKDEFAKANFQAEIEWGAHHFLSAVFLAIGLIYLLVHQSLHKSVPTFLAACTCSFTMLMVMNVPNIEGYTQRAAIEFFESKVGQDCYVDTYNYKSYADLYYSQKLPPSNSRHSDINWLLSNAVDKEVFISMKVTSISEFEEKYPDAKALYQKNGFAFYHWIPKPK